MENYQQFRQINVLDCNQHARGNLNKDFLRLYGLRLLFLKYEFFNVSTSDRIAITHTKSKST